MTTIQTLFVTTFPLARVDATLRALAVLSPEELIDAVARHLMGDWGELDEFEWKTTDQAVECGNRLVSRFRTARGDSFLVVTEADRTVTRIQLPGENLAAGRFH